MDREEEIHLLENEIRVISKGLAKRRAWMAVPLMFWCLMHTAFLSWQFIHSLHDGYGASMIICPSLALITGLLLSGSIFLNHPISELGRKISFLICIVVTTVILTTFCLLMYLNFAGSISSAHWLNTWWVQVLLLLGGLVHVPFLWIGFTIEPKEKSLQHLVEHRGRLRILAGKSDKDNITLDMAAGWDEAPPGADTSKHNGDSHESD